MAPSKKTKRAAEVRDSKRPKHAVDVPAMKRPGIEKNVHSHLGLYPTFSFRRYDAGAPWAVSTDGKPATDSVFQNLQGVEGLTWGNIIQASGGRSHGTNSHYIPLAGLSKDAKRRADDVGLDESKLFSLRLQGTVRLWGVIESNGCFYVIWYDKIIRCILYINNCRNIAGRRVNPLARFLLP